MKKLEQLRTEAEGLLQRLRMEMADYVIPDAPRKRLDDELAAIEQLLAGIQTYADARAARDKVDECERQWKKTKAAEWVEQAVLKGHTDSVTAIAFSPDGATLASCSRDKTVRLWDTSAALSAGSASGRERAVLKGHTDAVTAIAFSPDGATLASGSSQYGKGKDLTVRLWDVAGGRARAVLGHTSDVKAIVFSPDGATLASCSKDGTVRLWGLVVHKDEWARMERERKEWERKEPERREREEQQRAWRAAGRCEVCGAKLGFLEKLGGKTRCKRHR